MKPLFKIKYGPMLIDIGVILACMLFCEFTFRLTKNGYSLAFLAHVIKESRALLPLAADTGQTVAIFLLPVIALLFYAARVIMGCAFLPVAYFAFIKARMRTATEKKLVATEKDLYYFRDTFPGMKPATVSLLVNLNIDAKKDVPASLLQMVDKKLLRLDEAGFAAGSAKVDKMSKSEKELKRFALGETDDLSHWEALCIEEAVATGHLQRTGDDALRKQEKRYLIACGICFVFSIIATAVLNQIGGMRSTFRWVELAIWDPWAFFHASDFTATVFRTLVVWVVYAAFIVSFVLLVYSVFFEQKYKKLKAPVRRTAQGEKVARRLYGIKNYIHDFTLLGEATQKQVALWNDFLVYAVVLEENIDIIDEISRYYPSVKLTLLQRNAFLRGNGGKQAGI